MAIAMVHWRMALRQPKPHCKTCRCFVELKRHVCTNCKTRKLEKFMEPTGDHGAFGKEKWRCRDADRCNANVNYA